MTHTYIITYTIEMYRETLKLLPYLSCFFCPPILLCLFYMYLMDALSLFVVLFYPPPPPPHFKQYPCLLPRITPEYIYIPYNSILKEMASKAFTIERNKVFGGFFCFVLFHKKTFAKFSVIL